MCEPNPVRDVLAKSGMQEVEAVRAAALERATKAREAGDSQTAGLFARVAEDATQELADRLLAVATRECLRSARDSGRETRDLIAQMTS